MSRVPSSVKNVNTALVDHARITNQRGSIGRKAMPVPVPRTIHGDNPAIRVPAPRRHRRFPTSFCSTLRRNPPAIPPSLLRFVSELEPGKSNNYSQNGLQQAKKKDNVGPGRVKVLLRVCPQNILNYKYDQKSKYFPEDQESILRVEGNRKHVTIFDSESGLQSAQKRVGVSAPKLYAFDAVFPENSPQIEVCSTSLTDVIQAVVQGADGAVFCYGHSGLGKTYTLIGSDAHEYEAGLIPCGISWLYRAIGAMKEKTKGRYSVRVSAIEIHGRNEELKDLLKDFSKEILCLRRFGRLQNQCEIRASSAEKAAYLLDAALATRSSSGSRSTEEARRHSHMVYTLHVYQYRLDKTGNAGVSGGRSRLHFIDLGSCERTLVKTPNSLTLSLNSLGHVIMAIINNSKHVPFKESKLTLVLQELLGNFNCRAVMLAHVAKSSNHYADTLSTIQMASRIHRVLMKKKTKSSSTASVRGIGSNCHLPKSMKSHKRGTDEESIGTSSGVGETSGSEVSCDTVIYVRPNGVPYSDRELTDNEGPPPSVPIRTPPQVSKSLAKITETAVGSKIEEREKQKSRNRGNIPVSKLRQPHKSPHPKSQVLNTNTQMVHSTSNTQLKLENHAKLVKSLCENNNFNKSRIPTKHIKTAKKSNQNIHPQSKSKVPASHSNNSASTSKTKECHVNKDKSKKSRIPPPPPPRLPTTRLRHKSSDAPSASREDSARSNDHTNHHPTYETLHASYCSEDDSENYLGSGNDTDLSLELGEDHQRVHAWGDETLIGENVEEGIMYDDVELTADKEDQEGRENSQATHRRHRYGNAIQNISYENVTLSDSLISNPDLSKCFQDFENVLSSVEGSGIQKRKTSRSIPTNDLRPESMFVNVNDDEWNSDDDEDTYTSDNDVSEDGDVIDVNFYCLSFTTKNPLIPLSKRSFVKEVSLRKRLSTEGHGSDEATTGEDSERSGIIKEQWAEKVNRTFPPEKCMSDEAYQNNENVDKTNSSLRRSITFDANSGTPMELLPDCNDDFVNHQDSAVSGSDEKSPEESSIGQNSNMSSPSQVLLYDSSSLEINYVKPKSFNETKSMKRSKEQTEASDSNRTLTKAIPPKTTGMVRNKQVTGSKEILVTGAGDAHGTHLSLVKRTGGSTGLELVITSENCLLNEECAMPKEEKVRHSKKINSSRKLNQKSQSSKCNDSKQSPSKRLKWGGLKRLGSRKGKDEEKLKSPARKTNNNKNSPAKSKIENETVRNIKSASSPSTSFVSKLLSPKLRRSQKSPCSTSTASNDFRYRSPNLISQIRPDVVRTNSFSSTEQLKNTQLENGRLGDSPTGTTTSNRGETQDNTDGPLFRPERNRRNLSNHPPQSSPRSRFGFARKVKS